MILKMREKVIGADAVEVDSKPIVVASVVSSVATTVIAFLVFMSVTKPDAEHRRVLADKDFRAGMLARALQPDSVTDRVASIRLLLAAGLITIPDTSYVNRLLQQPDSPVTIPHWPGQGSSSQDGAAISDPGNQKPPA